ncbi:MAG: hypothetical protein NC132_02405 [Corallococcus sp.]|nr:hypothetical protein [Corallococcus sp.]MCM1358960.1 hypothetical protein [Corallococcus sp.]MCM1394949.1 hypothetical protein [Corallococcus sp.]
MQARVFKTGEQVTAEIMTEVVESVVSAEQNAAEAKSDSQKAAFDAAEARMQSDTALTDSQTASALSVSANSAAQIALEKATAVEQKAANGGFDGRNGIIAAQTGFVGFAIENGDLCVYCDGDQTPNFSLSEDGELIYNY